MEDLQQNGGKLPFKQQIRPFYNMQKYYKSIERDLSEVLPQTFHIKKGTFDPVFFHFKEVFQELEKKIGSASYLPQIRGGLPRLKLEKNLWIVKPGENTNRGVGINVCNNLKDIKNIIS